VCRVEMREISAEIAGSTAARCRIRYEQSTMPIDNPLSQSTIRNLNPQSAIKKSAIFSPKSAVDVS
jgi:hypothetical protein